MKHTLIIPKHHAHERLDQALSQLLPDYSRTQIQAWLESGEIKVNGKEVKAKTKVKGDETVSLSPTLSTKKPSFISLPQAIPLSIVHEDEALLIINKPVGLVVHPGAGHRDHTLLNALLHHAPPLELLPRAGILHRLDKDTSGLLIIAKTPAALKELSRQLKKHTLLREYQAIVYGLIISGGTIRAPIARHPIHRKRMAIVETGKLAVTHYRVMEKYRAHTRLHLCLETGRTHQIRVHLASIHHPVVGDTPYAGRLRLARGMTLNLIQKMRQMKRQALHAYALGLMHPLTQEWMRFEIDLPEDMQQLMAELRNDMKEKRK